METLLKYRWEHALIAKTVAEARATCAECTLGRTAIQKLIYFIRVLGVPMKYDFRIHHFGPFCDSIPAAMDWLKAGDVIEDVSFTDKSSNYRIGSTEEGQATLKSIFDEFQTELSEHESTIRTVVQSMVALSPEELEIVATLDFCYRWVRAQGGTGMWKQKTIDKFKSVKKDKFVDSKIDSWYSVLADTGLIQP